MKCNKCGEESNALNWNKEDQAKVGRWRMWDYEKGKPHEEICPKAQEYSQSRQSRQNLSTLVFAKADMYEKCDYCDGYFLKSDGNDKHVEVFHKDKIVHRGTHKVGPVGSNWEEEIWP